jgi:hypothetical protein
LTVQCDADWWQALHEQGLANADHTTLLFNCYTKLKDVQKLDEFIKVRQPLAVWALGDSLN